MVMFRIKYTTLLFTKGGACSMAQCEICNKSIKFGMQVSHSHRRTNRAWKPNVRKIKALINGTPKRINVCTRCLRSGNVTRA